MIYNAPEVKVLAALANVAATSGDDEEILSETAEMFCI